MTRTEYHEIHNALAARAVTCSGGHGSVEWECLLTLAHAANRFFHCESRKCTPKPKPERS